MQEASMTSSADGAMPPIRVLVVDDSVVMRSALARMLKHSPRIQLCGFAANGLEAVEKAKLLRPDVITLDVLMPLFDGLEALRQIMKECPCPVIMVSSMTREGTGITLDALDAGAFDYIAKEELFHADTPLAIRHVLLDRIEAAAHSALFPHSAKFARQATDCGLAASRSIGSDSTLPAPEVIAIGASTGGPKALERILTALPGGLPVPIVIVQHMPPGYTEALAARLDGVCELRVCEARRGERLQSGSVYIAPAGHQMTVFNAGRNIQCLCLSDLPANTLHKPSVDVLMQSVADLFGSHALGLILTGMGSDGLAGMTAIHEAGGITLGQDEATSAVYGMPRVCAQRGILQKSLPLSEIADAILSSLTAQVHG